jgi:cell division protein FtsQ
MGRRAYAGTDLLPGLEQPLREDAPQRQPRRPESNRRPRLATPRAVFRGVVLLAVLGAALYAFHRTEQFLIRDPRFTLSSAESIQIFGARHASRAALEAVFAEDVGRSVYLAPLQDRLASLRTVDWVRDASVARVWPNRLMVHVVEREPVAFVRLASRPGLIDAQGVILPPGRDRFDLPMLAGVSPRDSLVERREAVGRMLALTSALGEAAAEISEIDVSDPDNIVVSQSYRGRVLKLMLGDRNFAVRYGNFLNHYGEIETRLPGASVLDLRLETQITVAE